MSKTVRDLADITQVILRAAYESREIQVQFQSDWQAIKLGFVDPAKWRLPEFLFDSDGT